MSKVVGLFLVLFLFPVYPFSPPVRWRNTHRAKMKCYVRQSTFTANATKKNRSFSLSLITRIWVQTSVCGVVVFPCRQWAEFNGALISAPLYLCSFGLAGIIDFFISPNCASTNSCCLAFSSR